MRSFTHLRLVIGAIALSPFSALTAPAAAQVAAEVSPHESVVNAIEAGVDHEIALEATMAVLRREYASVPVMAQIEEMSPGTIDEIVTQIRPVFRKYQERIRTMYRPRMIDVFARNLSAEEAVTVAEFYRSDIGRRILNGVSRNYSPDEALAGVSDPANVNEERVAKGVATDIGNASAATVAELSQDDILELGRMAQANPVLLKLGTLGPEIFALRAEMELEAPTADEQAQIEAIVSKVLARRLAS